MNPQEIHICDYDYPLPDTRIARHPLAVRDTCRLLVSDGTGIDDCIFSDLPELLTSDTMLIYNNTRVINARLRFTKATGASIEIFCLEPSAPADYVQAFASTEACSWQCLVGNAKRWKEGTLSMAVTTASGATILTAEHADAPVAADNSRIIVFRWDNPAVSFADIIAAAGEIPIPPYLCRKSEATDAVDYQTVYSHIDGSVAAPTAGLHFTPALLDKLRADGIDIREVTLHVGAGTFRPVKTDTVGEHDMHSEFITVPVSFIRELSEAVGHRPIVAVGTTTVRTLESLYHAGRLVAAGKWTGEVPQWSPYDTTIEDTDVSTALSNLADILEAHGEDIFVARTRIIIAPGYTYRIVDRMITNFHQPASTLLLLVSAFIGDSWRAVYDHALAEGYRFLSYGDACLFTRRSTGNKIE